MGRTVKRRGPEPDVVVRLYDETWERWEFTAGVPRRLDPEAAPSEGGARRILAVPARQVIATPLWIEGTDAALAPEMVKLELEVRGLLPRVQGMAGVTLRLLPHENRTLAVAAVFPPEVPEGLPEGDAFDVSPFLLSLPRDAVTLWREGEDLVAGFTRGSDAVYWETIDRSLGADELRTWLGLLCLRLRGEGVIDASPAVVSWVEGLPAGRITPPLSLARDDQAEAEEPPPGIPTLRHARFDWKPVSAQLAEAQRARRERIKRVVLGVAAAYIVIAAGFTLYFGALRWQIARQSTETERLQAEVQTFQPIARDWAMIAPTATPSAFPLEILGTTVSGMPADGVRLIRFRVENGTMGVEGEADTFQKATDFFNALATAEGFRGFNLQSDTPQMKANNTASFNIRGTIPPP